MVYSAHMNQIHELISRSIAKAYPTDEALKKVLSGDKKLTIYMGFDPTGIQMHIGHMIGLRLMAKFQQLGHKMIFLIGDGTGQAGDPSGKTRSRDKYLTNEELRENATDYVMQAGKIVNFYGENPVEIRYNGDWLNKLHLSDILEIAGHFTLQQMIERDLYQERLKNNEPLNLREFLYPLLQGYDSVALEVDMEIGGSDQTFNMLIGRQLVKEYLNKEKLVLTTPLLTDASGRKIGKTEGNVIALNDKPEELYGKIMALGDDVIISGLTYLTDIPTAEISDIQEKLRSGEHPMPFKKRLAYEIVKQLHSDEEAVRAQEHFERTVQNKELPESLHEVTVSADQLLDENLLVSLGFVSSKSEAKRLFEQGGIELEGEKITGVAERPILEDNMILKVGKRNIVKIKTT